VVRQRHSTDWEQSMAKRLKALRQGAGLTQVGLAKAAGVPVRSYQQWEQGKRTPLFDAAVRVADALGVTLDELAGRKPKGGRKARGE
jgi:transcriptional regulator with XRE-family HTH domain